MVIPGDPEEMAEFQAQTQAASQYALEVTFPTAHVFLPSKEFYESIYNRSESPRKSAKAAGQLARLTLRLACP